MIFNFFFFLFLYNNTKLLKILKIVKNKKLIAIVKIEMVLSATFVNVNIRSCGGLAQAGFESERLKSLTTLNCNSN